MAADAKAADLIPRQTLFGNPERESPQLSPDGKRLAFLAPQEGVLNVWVAPVDAPEKAVAVTSDRERGIRQYRWAYTNDHIIYLQDQKGDENWRIHVVDVATKASRDLTPFDGVQARIEKTSSKTPNDILVALNRRSPELHDLYTLNLLSGELKLTHENEGFLGFECDEQYRPRLGMRYRPDGCVEMIRIDGKTQSEFTVIPAGDDLTTTTVGFDESGDTLYMVDSRGENTSRCVAVEFKTGKQTPIAADTKADSSDILTHPTKKTVQAVAFEYDRTRWEIVDATLKPDFEYLKTICDGDFAVLSRTLDDQRWLVEYTVDNGPTRFYLYDRGAKSNKFLFTNRPALEKASLARMHAPLIPARDGLELVSYLTLPPASDPDNDARPTQPLPMVLVVHGGPWARDEWGYDALHQWLANRGYAVLSVNFRGSTGFGKKFINAANLQWGRTMHDDLLDGVAWAVKNRIADPKRVAILGGSYGGYATLWGMTNSADVFCCGVDIVGPSNLKTLLDSIPPYWAPMLEVFARRVGDPRTEEGKKLLIERSPLTYVDQIRKPLLIGQGANDPRVKQAESDQIVRAMQEKKIPVTYVLYPDEGHGFARPENSISFWAVTEAFLAKHLGGKAEPIGDDLKGSSLQIKTGAADVGVAG
ncbi:MAG: S9 family peptidase [Phycisphaerae bacterium]|nr:S9 family peptidase [Phycisphaerae bacterium]